MYDILGLYLPDLCTVFFFFCYQENYGKADQARVEKVKELYKALDLQVSLPAFS